MEKKRLHRKAVSPLIATVLLIAFAVALGAVVMNWGKAYVQTTTKDVGEKSSADMSCQLDVHLAFKEIAGTPKICYNNTSTQTSVQFMIENNGNAEIKQIRLTVIGENDEVNSTDLVNSSIAIGSILKKTVTYSSGLGAIQQVEIKPYVKPSGLSNNALCAENGIIKDNVAKCS